MHERHTHSEKARDGSQKSGLFTSEGGLSLPTEICLKIVEDVIDANPMVGSRALKAVSKEFNALLHSYEHSIIENVSKNLDILYPATLLSSWPRNMDVSAHTYSWLCEIRCRKDTIESMLGHDVTSMVNSGGIDLPLPDVPEPELSKRVERFKRDAIHLMYGIADSTIPHTDIHAVRAAQCSYLESLTTTQLAVLGVISRVLGLGYFWSIKAESKTSDSIRERWIVFEDRLLKLGPFFAWAAVIGTHEIHDWSEEVISDALDDMEDFETGKVQGYASLQSALWKLFCTRTECDVFDSWEEARQRVEEEMISYEV